MEKINAAAPQKKKTAQSAAMPKRAATKKTTAAPAAKKTTKAPARSAKKPTATAIATKKKKAAAYDDELFMRMTTVPSKGRRAQAKAPDPFFEGERPARPAPKKARAAKPEDPFFSDALFEEQPAAPKKRRAKPAEEDPFFSEDLFDEPRTKRAPRKSGGPPRGGRGGKGKQNEWWTAPAAVVLLLILGLFGYLATSDVSAYAEFRQMREVVERQTFYSGITIDGVDVSGMTFSEAMSNWAQDDQNQRARYSVTLSFEDKQWTLTSDDLGYHNDYAQVISSAYAVGRYGSLESRYAQGKSSDGAQRAYTVSRGADKEALRAHVEAIAEELTIQPKNAKIASFDRQTLSFVYTEAEAGLVVDKQALYDEVVQTINAGGSAVAIRRERVQPTRTASELGSVYGEISSATTNASSSSGNRITNIQLSCEAIDGYLIKPGETFSFNEVVGKRTKDRGYKKAGAIENGVMTQEYGGGICQTSTTLFNAVAKADLQIVERSPHSRPSTYVDIGKDAAVDWPNKDLKFKNNTDSPVYISARVTDKKRIVIAIYGKKLDDGMSIVIESKKTQTINPGSDKYIYDDSLATGATKVVESARKGYKAEAYKVYLDRNGDEIKREPLCKSSYGAAGAIIRIGP